MVDKKKKSKKKKRQPEEDPAARVIDVALEIAAVSGWRTLNMADIAEETGLGLAEIHAIYPCKTMILNGLVQRIDEQVLAGGEADGDSTRDRLFDMLMRRFDALTPVKSSIRAIVSDTCCDPGSLLLTGPRMLSSMYWTLEAANVNASGLMGVARCEFLLLVYAYAFRAWLKDESEDMAATMVALDRGLQQAERLESFCRGR